MRFPISYNFRAANANAAFGWREMDGAPNTGRVQEFGLGAAYTFANPNLSAFAEYRYVRTDQTDEGDFAIENSFGLGVAWAFGSAGAGRAASRASLPNYLEWVASSDGHLE